MMILKIDPNEVRWFAMSSPYCREMKAKELLDSHGIKNFIPMVRKQVVVDDELETSVTGAKNKRFVISLDGVMALACKVECKFVKRK